MNVNYIHTLETPPNSVDKGKLQVNVISKTTNEPIKDAVVTISYTGDPNGVIEKLISDSQGQTEIVVLPAPPLEYSMAPGNNQPYSEYNITVNAPGFEPCTVSGSNLLPTETSLQDVNLVPLAPVASPVAIVIPAHTLYGYYPPKIAESEIKPVGQPGEIVLSRVVIPEFVVVHDGVPTDPTAENHYVRYRDYIKNVASSEIYSTWPESTLRANILAIMSFTLNRVYTEWYRNSGYNFTITSSTAFDHKWMNGRNIFQNISVAVDEIFASYLSRPNVKQPILTQYCDGKRVSCPNWLSQWGSKYLGDQNYKPIEIIHYYYGDTMYINSAEEIAGVPSSWPGANLDIGTSGPKVQQMQEQLNRISQNYNAIPLLSADGKFGEKTAEAVKAFQKIFKLPETGVVDYPTWYKISDMFVKLSRIAELE